MGRPPKNKPAQSKPQLGVKPLAGYILIKPQEAETTTASGIVLPDSAKEEKQGQGEVISVGGPIYLEGKEINSPVSVGQVVLYKKWGGDEVKLSGVEYKIVKFEDVMAIFE